MDPNDATKQPPTEAEREAAEKKTTDVNGKSDADKAADEAREAEQKAEEARTKAETEGKSEAQRDADKAAQDADDARAKAEQARRDAGGEGAATTAAEAKSASAVEDPDRLIGDHLAQKFSNTPANPALAPGLDAEIEGKVKLTMETSDTIARGSPNVAFVHPEMVGDYLRAGWSKAA